MRKVTDFIERSCLESKHVSRDYFHRCKTLERTAKLACIAKEEKRGNPLPFIAEILLATRCFPTARHVFALSKQSERKVFRARQTPVTANCVPVFFPLATGPYVGRHLIARFKNKTKWFVLKFP